MEPLSEAIFRGTDPDDLNCMPVPADFAAAHLRQADAGIFRDAVDKDVRSSLRVDGNQNARLFFARGMPKSLH